MPKLTVGRLKQLISGFDDDLPVSIANQPAQAPEGPLNHHCWNLLSVYPGGPGAAIVEVCIDIGMIPDSEVADALTRMATIAARFAKETAEP